jgi:hypothetical protein
MVADARLPGVAWEWGERPSPVYTSACGQQGITFTPVGAWSPDIVLTRDQVAPQGLECRYRFAILDRRRAISGDRITLRAHTEASGSGICSAYALANILVGVSDVWQVGSTNASPFDFAEFAFKPSDSGTADQEDAPAENLCIIEIILDGASNRGFHGLDVRYRGEGIACENAINDGHFRSVGARAIEHASPFVSSLHASPALIPPPQPEDRTVLRWNPAGEGDPCSLSFRVVSQPYVRYLTSRIAIVREMTVLTSLHRTEFNHLPGETEGQTLDRLAEERTQLVARLDQAPAMLLAGNADEPRSMIIEGGNFLWRAGKSLMGPTVFLDLLVDKSNQKPSPLEIRYMSGLRDPNTFDIFVMNKEDLQEMKAAYERGISILRNMNDPNYAGSIEAMEQVLSHVSRALHLQEIGVDVSEMEQIRWDLLKPIDMDPGMIDTFDPNSETMHALIVRD